MADKTYKMTVGLSNGSLLNAGNFVVPGAPMTFSWQYSLSTAVRTFQDIMNNSPFYEASVNCPYRVDLAVLGSGLITINYNNTADVDGVFLASLVGVSAVTTSLWVNKIVMFSKPGNLGDTDYYNAYTSASNIDLSLYNTPSIANILVSEYYIASQSP